MNRSGTLMFVITLGLMIFCRPLVSGADREHYHYLIQTGESRLAIDWRLEKSQGFSLVYETAEETSITQTDHQYRTVRWEYRNPGKQTNVIARRRDNVVVISGVYNGHRLERRLSVNDAPWYQAVSLSLRPFVLSSRKKTKFWFIRPDTLTEHLLIAEKRETTMETVLGQSAPVREIKLGLPGLLAALGGAFYWFHETSGLFVRYEGPSGPPGSPRTVIRLMDQL